MTVHGLVGVLDCTKKSGPEKRIRFLPIFVSKLVYFMNADWLAAGWSVWTSATFETILSTIYTRSMVT